MKAILIDDEPMALEVLEKTLSKFKDVEVLGSYTNPHRALEEINKKDIDLVFLDIELGRCNGIEMAQLFINENPSLEIVFVTAYSQYAVDAFEVNALDYLLKPVQEKRLKRTMERVNENIKRFKSKNKRGPSDSKYLKIRSFEKLEVMDSSGKPMNWRTQKSKELFTYLWLNKEKPVSKDVIMETIFPDRDMEKASTILHTTIYQIRKNLGNLGFPDSITYKNNSYQLNIATSSDKEELDKVLTLEGIQEGDIDRILEIYIGDFLQEESYHWIMDIQQKYKDLTFNALEKYVKGKLEKKEADIGVKNSIETMLRIDPFRECAVRYMMEYYGLKNMQSYLKSFFWDYKERLSKEMQLKPMDRTVYLYNKYMN